MSNPMIGGVCLFTRNFCDVAQLAALCHQIHELRAPPLLIGVDHEGGRVQRFRGELTELPPPAALRPLYDRDENAGEEVASALAWLMAAELLAVGVDFSFAPVVDLDHGVSSVITDRALHSDPEAVYRLARAWVRGSADAGMASVAKHFPGHGGCAADSHVALPRDERSLAALQGSDLVPFRRLIDNNLQAVMASHVLYPAIDAEAPAGFSRTLLADVLRERLGFQGAVFSDDLGMAAVRDAGALHVRSQRAINAGCDMVLACNEPPNAVDTALARLQPPDPAAALRLARLRGRAAVSGLHSLHGNARWQSARRRIEQLHPGLRCLSNQSL